jgi:DNA-binding transcriptional LysR family regulator
LTGWQENETGVELILHDVWGKKAQELLLSGALDCVLLARQDPLPIRFDTVPLMTETFELAYATDHPISGDEPLELNDLNGLAYLDRLRCEFRETVFGIAEEKHLEVDVIMRSEREDWIQNLVAAGLGVTMLPRNSIVVDGISTRPVKGLPTKRTIEIVTVRGRPLRNVVKRFVDFIGGYDFNAL